MSRYDVQLFSLNLKRILSEKHNWARDMVYMIQIKGVKEGHRHNPDYQQAQVALENFLEGIDTSHGSWFVDVGLEVSEPEKAYLWRTDSHAACIQEMVDVGQRRAIAATNISNRLYSRDLTSHILDLAGFRLNLVGQSKGRWNTEYVQLYTTDKALVYHLEKGRHSKQITGREIICGNPPTFIQDLYKSFRNALNSVDCAARAELRVPVSHARDVLLEISPELLSRSLVVYPRKIWW
jgi:hypothetical protein